MTTLSFGILALSQIIIKLFSVGNSFNSGILDI